MKLHTLRVRLPLFFRGHSPKTYNLEMHRRSPKRRNTHVPVLLDRIPGAILGSLQSLVPARSDRHLDAQAVYVMSKSVL